MKLKNKIIKLSAISAFCLTGLASIATAEETLDQAELDLDLKALPELADALQNAVQNKSASPRMQCYIDTAAYDLFSYGFCFALDYPRTTTAVFHIDDAPSNSTVIWSDSRCGQGAWCSLPIRHYQQINLSATVLDHSNNTFNTVSARAWYEGWH